MSDQFLQPISEEEMIERYLKPAIKNYIAYEEKRMMEEFLDMEREGNSFAPKQIG